MTRRGGKRKRSPNADGPAPGKGDAEKPAPEIRMSAEEAEAKLREVLPRIAEAAEDQDGSRFLQWRLSEGIADDDERDRILEAVMPSAVKLASDVFGNFVVQKLFERASEDQRKRIAGRMRGEIYNLSNHKYGCRVVQKMLELLPGEAQADLVAELETKVLDCVENMHGNHVVQIIVKAMPCDRIGFVVSAITGSADKMAGHMYGCRVIQRLLERCTHEQLATLTGRIVAAAEKLASDRHGNYVVQCILEHGRKEDKQRIIDIIRQKFVYFAKNKVSSNVVERCFQAATVGPDAEFLAEDRSALYRTVLGGPSDSQSPLRQLVNDKFGNYTVQCVIRHSRGSDRETLKERIMAMEPELRTQTGKHILACLKKLEEGGDDAGGTGKEDRGPDGATKDDREDAADDGPG